MNYPEKSSKNLHTLTILFLSILIFVGCGIKPPKESGDFKKSNLVELITTEPSYQLDIRYASSNNFVGRPVYEEARVFLQHPAAMALAEVNKNLKPLGYGLKIFDGYRPWRITKLFWNITPKKDRAFVANPKKGSRHNRGCAIDLTLFDIYTGREIEMPSAYDEFSERAHPNYKGGTDEQRKMRDLLRTNMEAYRFQVYENEWWHFDYQDWKQYRIQNIGFSEIK